jgi:hypothetical protein
MLGMIKASRFLTGKFTFVPSVTGTMNRIAADRVSRPAGNFRGGSIARRPEVGELVGH